MTPKLLSAVDRAASERWDNTLRGAAEEVFAMMVGTALSPIAENDAQEPAGFTAMVGFAGALTGVLTIRCDRKSAAVMASKMLGLDGSEGSEQQWDAIGEICNMVAGNFKAKVDGLQDKCLISVPTVITGGDYQMHSLASGERIEVRMLFEGAPVVFTLEVTP
jgi:chemotaxis protein CheX